MIALLPSAAGRGAGGVNQPRPTGVCANFPPAPGKFLQRTAAKAVIRVYWCTGCFRNSVFRILPVALRGSAGTRTICLGNL